jgi:hypothetical protein
MKRKGQKNLLTVPRGVEVTPVELRITGKLSYQQWSQMMKGLQRAHRSMLWVLGDGFVYGEGRFGEAFAQAIEEYSRESARNAMWVSAMVPPVRRLTDLSWSHHQAVAHLPADEQAKFLKAAVEKNFTVGELRAAVRLSQDPEPKPDWQEPRDPPDDVIITNDEEPAHEYEETREQIVTPIGRANNVEFEFKHLLDLVKALRDAVHGNLAAGVEPDEGVANRLWAALECFIAEHEQ